MVLVPIENGYLGGDCLPCLFPVQEVQATLKTRSRHNRSNQLKHRKEKAMNNFWKYIKAAAIVAGVSMVAYYGYKKIRKMFA
jgi:hypothetical protein